MVRKTLHSFKEFYKLFTSGMTSSEIEKLVSYDTRGMYTFYVKNMPPKNPNESKIARVMKFGWRLFVAFLVKLTPARRLFYAIAVALIGLAFWDADLMKALYAFLIVNFLLALELADKLVTRDELEFARQIQLSLLPGTLIPVAGFDVASYSEVAQSVGGDYYDLLPLSDGSTMVVVGDVSGKGISAALYMVKVQTALQLLVKETADPQELLIKLNEYMCGQMKRNFFLTISVLRTYPDGSVTYCRAGHMPALKLDARTRVCSWLQPRGTAIGLAAADPSGVGPNGEIQSIFRDSLQIEEISMQQGDTLILYTDGVVESVNRAEEEFGEGRLMQVLMSSAGSSAAVVKENLLGSLSAFRRGEELRDDTTFVVLRRKERHSQPVESGVPAYQEK